MASCCLPHGACCRAPIWPTTRRRACRVADGSARMRDLAFVAFLAGILAMGIRRPFLFVLAYIYVDTVSPQRLSYFLLNTMRNSMIVAVLAMGGWLIADRKDGFTLTARQGLFMVLLAYAGMTSHITFPPAVTIPK